MDYYNYLHALQISIYFVKNLIGLRVVICPIAFCFTFECSFRFIIKIISKLLKSVITAYINSYMRLVKYLALGKKWIILDVSRVYDNHFLFARIISDS